MSPTLQKRLIGVAAVLLVGAVLFYVWVGRIAEPTAEALAVLQSDSRVTVETERWLVFTPAGKTPDTGLIFYPGGRVDARAYAPPAKEIAAQGYLVVVVPMPFGLATLGVDRAADVIAAFPEIEHWAIGGHSLGGAMAAQFVARHPGAVEGLVLWAAYPPDDVNLSEFDLQVVSIYGTLDGLATPAEVVNAKPQLPPTAGFLSIIGGNHAQFGHYGPQRGDNPAETSHASQQAQAIAYTLAVLSVIEK